LAILGSAFVVAVFLLYCAYFLHASLFAHGLVNAVIFRGTAVALGMPVAYAQVGRELASSGPVLVVLAPVCLGFWIAWRRSRYFGNTAPLVVAVLFLVLRVASPHGPDSIYGLLGAIFLFVFVAGVSADLLETKAREFPAAVLVGLVAANALFNVISLARIGH
jgi:hypothetical protein